MGIIDLADFSGCGSLLQLSHGQLSHGRRMQNWSGAVEQRASQLREAGLETRTAAVLWHANSIDFFVDLFAIWQIGAVAIPGDPSTPDLRRQQLQNALMPALVLEGEGAIERRESLRNFPLDSALVLLTSGSTAQPKGILHSKSAIIRKMQLLAAAIDLEDFDTTLLALPTFFGHGLICNGLFPLLHGRSLIVAPGFTPSFVSDLDRLIEEHLVTFVSSTPTVWSFVENFSKKRKKPTLRRIHCASAPLDFKRMNTILNWAPQAKAFNVYGLTETLGWIAGQWLQPESDPRVVGQLWGSEIKIESDHRISIRSEAQAQAYFEITEKTEDLDFEIRPLDCWFQSSDLGEWCGEKIRLLGRQDFMIIKAGLKVQPEEVELIASQFRGIDSAVCVAIDDQILGSQIGLAVVRSGNLSLPFESMALRKWLSERLESYKIPDQIKVLDRLPVNTRGKVDRKKLLAEWGR